MTRFLKKFFHSVNGNFRDTKIIITKKLKGGVKMPAGRPKAENPKTNVLHIRLTDAELAEIENLATKLKISKTETILRGIKQAKKNSKSF